MKPGRLIDPRLQRRLIITVTTAIWILFISPFPRSLDGIGMPLTLCLLALDLLMCISSDWLGWKPTRSIDERQAAFRNRAYRIAFRLILLSVLMMILAIFIGSFIASLSHDFLATQTPVVLGGRWIVGLMELLIATPTAVILWLQPDSVDERVSEDRSELPARRWLPLLAVPGLAAMWLLALGAAPTRAQALPTNVSSGLSVSGATCDRFSRLGEVGLGFGADVPLDVEACWDGVHAYVFRQGLEAELTRCVSSPGDADFARITALTCTEHADSDGTMRYTVHARVQPWLISAIRRDVLMELDITRDGKVLAFR